MGARAAFLPPSAAFPQRRADTAGLAVAQAAECLGRDVLVDDNSSGGRLRRDVMIDVWRNFTFQENRL